MRAIEKMCEYVCVCVRVSVPVEEEESGWEREKVGRW